MRSLNMLAIAASLAALALGAQAQGTQTAGTAQAADGAQPGTQATGGAADTSAAVKAAFRRADTNNDGKLSREEAAALPAVAEKFTQLDKDSDGGITAMEFEAGVTMAQPASK